MKNNKIRRRSRGYPSYTMVKMAVRRLRRKRLGIDLSPTFRFPLRHVLESSKKLASQKLRKRASANTIPIGMIKVLARRRRLNKTPRKNVVSLDSSWTDLLKELKAFGESFKR